MSSMFANGWDAARARAAMLLDPAVTNLNTGSFGPLPHAVFDHVTALRRRLAEEPMDFLLRQLPGLLWTARERLAVFIGADVRRLAFAQNVTAAVNSVASGLQLASPGEVLLSDHEYGAMQWCWERAARRAGLTLRTFPVPAMASNPDEVVAACCAAITPRTRLLFFSHVLSPTGMVLPARALCAEARRRGIITVVDGAHAPAMIALNLDDVGADFYGANCHKWLLAPTGSGFLYFGPGSADRLIPLQVSWGGRPDHARLDERDEFGTTPRLRYLEFEGTRDVCPWLAVPAAIDFQASLGFEHIRAANAALVAFTRERFGRLGLPLATPDRPGLHGFMTAFGLPASVRAADWRRALWERFHIEVPIVERPDRLLLRVSTHFYNTPAEVERLAAAVEILLAECAV